MVRHALTIALALLTFAPAPSPAGAERQCGEAGCVSVAWPDRSVDTRDPAALEALASGGMLTDEDMAAASRLVERRLSLRIRGLELRYLFGKTAAAGGEAAALAPIRHQIEAIDLEIDFIDQELARVLDAASRGTGPWLVRTGDGPLWLVTAPPCRETLALAMTDDTGAWREAEARPEPDPPGVDLPSDCPPLRLTATGSPVVRLRLDGVVAEFRFAE